jgi:hypothetical protein
VTPEDGASEGPDGNRGDAAPPPGAPEHPDSHSGRDDRVARMHDGLNELDRWLVDRMRTGLADPSLARYETWDALASRLVDARAGSLANRIRRLAGVVGASPDWHERVLDEIGLLHLLSQAGRRLGTLPDPLADRVATTIGWQVRQDDVLAGVPDTDDWIVAGRSDTREDRIEVRRFWLYGTATNRWALALSFAAYRQSLDESLRVGTSIRADLHRYPGGALRALVGDRFGEPVERARPPAVSVVEACGRIGSMLAVEPWLDRVPAVVHASLTHADRRWVLTDHTGTLPLHDAPTIDGRVVPGLDVLLAVSGGGPIDLTIEWTPTGIVPLAIHRPTGSIDIGPRAEPSFVGPPPATPPPGGARGQAPRTNRARAGRP